MLVNWNVTELIYIAVLILYSIMGLCDLVAFLVAFLKLVKCEQYC